MKINKSAALPSDMDKIGYINREISSLHSIFQSCTETINDRKQKIALLQYEMEQLPEEGYVAAVLPYDSIVRLPADIARDLIMREINSTYDSLSHLVKALEVMKSGKD